MLAAASDRQSFTAPASQADAVLRLTLTEFRCYDRLRLETGSGPVVLTGPNGAGKTAILEALSLLAPGKGLRRATLGDIARRRPGGTMATQWSVAALVDGARGTIPVGTGQTPDGGDKRVVRIDGQPVKGQKTLAEFTAIAWATPEQDRLFLDGPGARRRFIDRLVLGFAPDHASELSAYEHCLRERARLLAESCSDDRWLGVLEDGMARHGVAVTAARAAIVTRLDSAAAAGIGPFPAAQLALQGDIDRALATMPALAAEDWLRARLGAARKHDAMHGGATHGPHRSDLNVRFAQKDIAAADGSTGEQKALVLSIVLANARALAAERGRPPILLLDEVVAHLDGVRRAALSDEIVGLGAQVWLTGTDDDLFMGLRDRARFFRVLDSTVTPR